LDADSAILQINVNTGASVNTRHRLFNGSLTVATIHIGNIKFGH